MTAIVVAPELELCLTEKRGIFTVPAEDCLVRCNCPYGLPCEGILVRGIGLQHRKFELLAHDMETRFVERQAVRGFELMGNELRLHGPFWSYDFNSHLSDIEAAALKEAQRRDANGDQHPEKALGVVFEREEHAYAPYRDYLLVGQFLKRAVLTEVIVREAEDGI